VSKPGRPFRQAPQGGSQMVNVSRQPGFPSRLLMKHKFTDAASFDVTGTLGKLFVSANGMYLPSAGAHQPSYFDTMSSIYNHWTVIGAVIKVHFTQTNVLGVVPAICCVQQNDDATFSPTTIATVSEQANAQTVYLVNGSGGNEKTVTMKYSTKGTFGGSVLSNNDLQGSSAANPADLTYWLIAVQATDAASRIVVNVMYEVEYLAVWTELKDIAQS